VTSAIINGLTHLLLTTISINAVSSFELALRYGTNLRSLRIKGTVDGPHSQYFQRYSQALPFLVEFGIYSPKATKSDTDFFPSVCDFLCPKAVRLVHLELGGPDSEADQDRLGFNGGKWCWDMFRTDTEPHTSNTEEFSLFPNLESLAMTLPTDRTDFSSKLIPKGVTRLTLCDHEFGSDPRRVFKSVSIISSPHAHYAYVLDLIFTYTDGNHGT
jgi:hypothetical protein